MAQPCKLALSIAATCSSTPSLAGFNFGPIIQDLITALEGCLTTCFPAATGETAQQEAADAYNGTTYEHGTLLIATRKAKNAGHKNGERLNNDQAQQAAILTLDGIRTGNVADVQDALSSVNASQ